MSLSLLVMCPTRWRRENCERQLKSFAEATDSADIVYITDADDQDTYRDMDWGDAVHSVVDFGEPTGSVRKQNLIAMSEADNYDALMYIGDDHLFSTPHWDTILMQKLEDIMGGTGMIYGDDKRRQDIPEMIIISSDIVKELGHFAEPSLDHYYIDNCWAELGARSGLIRFCPDVVFEHLHYQVNPDVEHDQTYRFAENNWAVSDFQRYESWRAEVMPFEVARLRRKFNKDLKWLFSKI